MLIKLLTTQLLAPRLRRAAPSVPRGYPSDSRMLKLTEKIPPGESLLYVAERHNQGE
jgi:hypothetical protein